MKKLLLLALLYTSQAHACYLWDGLCVPTNKNMHEVAK